VFVFCSLIENIPKFAGYCVAEPLLGLTVLTQYVSASLSPRLVSGQT